MVAISVLSQNIGGLSLFLHRYRWLVVVGLGTGAAVDSLNTAALCFYLRKGKPESSRQ